MKEVLIALSGVAFGWVLFLGTKVWRTRRRESVALRRFQHEIVALLVQARKAVDNLDDGFSGDRNENLSYDYRMSLPNIETFSEITHALPGNEMDFAAQVVQYWNYRRRVEPGGIPDDSGVKDLIELLGCRIFLRKPFAWIFHPKDSEICRSRIRELTLPPPNPESESAKNASAE